MTVGSEFFRMHRGDGSEICFWAVVPIVENELIFKMEQGVDALMDAFDTSGITDIVNHDRSSALGVKKHRGWWPFGAR